jgi:HSP20 family protein
MFERMARYENPLLSQMRRLEQELEDVFGSSSTLTGTRDIRSLPAGTFPAVNVGATPEEIAVYLFAPGLDAKELDISLHQGLLSIGGEREIRSEKGATYYRQERFGGAFRRSISLPDDVDPDRVNAQYANGVLRITIGRKASAKPRQIEVH